MSRSKITLGASSAKRWLSCTASPLYILAQEKNILKDNETSYSLEGTEAHEKAANALETLDQFTDDEYVNGYVEYCRTLQLKSEYSCIELRKSLWYHPTRNCVIDFGCKTKDGVLHIVDYKHGKGVSVKAYKNPQIAIYGRTLYNHFNEVSPGEIKEIYLSIYQPRTRDVGDDPLETWVVSPTELLEFTDSIAQTAQNIVQNKETQFSPSPTNCQFCEVAAFCTSRVDQLISPIMANQTTKIEFKSPENTVDFEQVIRHSKEIRKWLDSVEEYTKRKLLEGGKVEGLKLVEGRATRVWSNDKEAEKFLRKRFTVGKIFSKKMISPAQAQKLLKDASSKINQEFQKHVFKTKPGAVVALSEDNRSFYESSATNQFDSE